MSNCSEPQHSQCIHRLFIFLFFCFPWAETALCVQHTRKQLLSTLSTDQTSLSIFFCVTCTEKSLFLCFASIAFVVFVFIFKVSVEISTEKKKKKTMSVWMQKPNVCDSNCVGLFFFLISALISYSNDVFKWKTNRKRRIIIFPNGQTFC